MTKEAKWKEDTERMIAMFGRETWNSFTPEGQRSAIKNFDKVYQTEVRKIEDVLREIRDRRRNQFYLLMGVLLGISGGMVGNIIEKYFEKFGFLYEVIVVGAFIGFIVAINIAFNSIVSDLVRSNEGLSYLLRKAQEKLGKKD